ncbi:hypothetical protein FQN55_000797 [Onygenales sp. PD_40]|nr:hypothetical protein FQN55_000797 [Onygenales sp. PD_40]KAK2788389.1 hypothetical protein FQN52_006713 [Onygenales sp. PD_12]
MPISETSDSGTPDTEEWDASPCSESPSDNEEIFSPFCPRRGRSRAPRLWQLQYTGSSIRRLRKRTVAAQGHPPSECSEAPTKRVRRTGSSDEYRDRNDNDSSSDTSEEEKISSSSQGPVLNPHEAQLTSQAEPGFTVNDQYMTPEIWMQYYERARSSTLMAEALEEEKRKNMYAMLAMEIKIVEKNVNILELLDLVLPLCFSVVEAKEGFQKLWEEFLIPLSSVGVAPTAKRQGQKEEVVAKLEEIREMSIRISAFAEGLKKRLEKRQGMEGET